MGSAGVTPKVGTPCECHYAGTLIDGTEFDSSYKRGQPTTFAPNQVIKGWTEAMQLMGEGDKWELYVPSELAYGDRQRGQHITPGAVLVFEIEILEVKGDSKPKAAAWGKTHAGCPELRWSRRRQSRSLGHESPSSERRVPSEPWHRRDKYTFCWPPPGSRLGVGRPVGRPAGFFFKYI